MSNIIEIEVAFAAITDPVRLTPSDPPYYVVFCRSEEWFISATQPRLYDAACNPIAVHPIPAASIVNLSLDRRRRIEAIQIVALAEACPFARAA